MPTNCRLRGLYALTDTKLCASRGLTTSVEAAIRGGAVMIQYRDKNHDNTQRRHEAAELRAICSAAGVPLIINDDVELALAVGADGVHLGAHDASIRDARMRLGADAIVGASCYASLELAREAQSEGADYVGFGSFHASPTKPQATQAESGLLSDARSQLQLPIAAIGGINAGNGVALIAAGADLLAVISGIFGTEDIETSAREIAGLFKQDSR